MRTNKRLILQPLIIQPYPILDSGPDPDLDMSWGPRNGLIILEGFNYIQRIQNKLKYSTEIATAMCILRHNVGRSLFSY